MTEIDNKAIIDLFKKVSDVPPDGEISWGDVDFVVAAAKTYILIMVVFAKPTLLANLCDEIRKTWQRVQFTLCSNGDAVRYKIRLEFLAAQASFIKSDILPRLKARKMLRRDYWRFRILEKIRNSHKISSKNVCIATSLKYTTVLPILRELKAAGLIRQVSKDGLLSITPEGITHYNEIADIFAMSKMVAPQK